MSRIAKLEGMSEEIRKQQAAILVRVRLLVFLADPFFGSVFGEHVCLFVVML